MSVRRSPHVDRQPPVVSGIRLAATTALAFTALGVNAAPVRAYTTRVHI
jgi:hypothetical protein